MPADGEPAGRRRRSGPVVWRVARGGDRGRASSRKCRTFEPLVLPGTAAGAAARPLRAPAVATAGAGADRRGRHSRVSAAAAADRPMMTGSIGRARVAQPGRARVALPGRPLTCLAKRDTYGEMNAAAWDVWIDFRRTHPPAPRSRRYPVRQPASTPAESAVGGVAGTSGAPAPVIEGGLDAPFERCPEGLPLEESPARGGGALCRSRRQLR
jgi:hypothetical protein